MENYLLVALVAFFCETVDSSLGMGYGTILTPVLLLAGYEPLEIVPLILFSEFITGILAAGLHHKKGNVKFTRDSKESKVALTLALCSIIGTISAVFISLSIPRVVVKGYIAFLLLIIGSTNMISFNKEHQFSWKKISMLGIVASFNKGLSGGGYGPVVTGGQLLSGLNGKSAVAITSLAEGLTCLVGVVSYLFLNQGFIDWYLGLALIGGALCSIPISVNVVKIISEIKLRIILTGMVFTLGLLTFVKTFSSLIRPENLPLVIVTVLITIPFGYVWGNNHGNPL